MDTIDALAKALECADDIPAAQRERRCVKPPVGCGKPLEVQVFPDPYVGRVHFFRDSESGKEYMLSALCQQCQDKVFGTE